MLKGSYVVSGGTVASGMYMATSEKSSEMTKVGTCAADRGGGGLLGICTIGQGGGCSDGRWVRAYEGGSMTCYMVVSQKSSKTTKVGTRAHVL